MKSLTYQRRTAPDEIVDVAKKPAWRMWVLAVCAAALLVSLGVAFAMLVSAPKRTIDALVIVTIPSGAEVFFDGKSLGPSPVKLEGVRTGSHSVRVEKEGFIGAAIDVVLDADDGEPLELRLKPVAPPGSVARTPAEQISEFTALAEDAFVRDDLVLPADRSALYYADAILSLDPKSGYANNLRDRIRERLLADARAAAARKDLARAKAAYEHLLRIFPGDAVGRAGLNTVDEQLDRERNRLQEFLTRAKTAYDEGSLVAPEGRSALAYTSRALAVDPDNQQARALRRRIRNAAVEEAHAQVERGDTEQAVALLRRLVTLFPEDRALRAELDELMRGAALEAFREHRDAGMKAFRAGNYREAVDKLEAAGRLGALDARAYSTLGLSHMRLGGSAEAKRALERAVVQDEKQVEALVALGTIAERAGDLPEAIKYYKRAAKLGGTNDYGRARLEATIASLEQRAESPSRER